MVKQILTSLTMVLVLGGCASTPENTAGTKAAISEKPKDRLAARNLEAGECGIFVWTKDKARRFILFSQYEKPTASWWEDGSEVMLTRTLSEGCS